MASMVASSQSQAAYRRARARPVETPEKKKKTDAGEPTVGGQPIGTSAGKMSATSA